MLYLSNACFSDILCRNNQPCSEGFFAVLSEKKIEYLLETKVSNRLLLVLGVISPRAKRPFILFDISVFHSSRASFKACIWVSKFPGEDFLFVFGGISG